MYSVLTCDVLYSEENVASCCHQGQNKNKTNDLEIRLNFKNSVYIMT